LFFQDLKQVKAQGTTEYRHGKDVVATFPDELTLRVEIARGLTTMPMCGVTPNFDSATVQVRAEWWNGSQRIAAKGTVVRTDWEASAIWCEDSCGGYWEYELRINSENVPLKDRLVVRVDTENGAPIAEYVGELQTIHSQCSLVLRTHLDPDRSTHEAKGVANLVFQEALIGKVQFHLAVGKKNERGRSHVGLG
jgi:hypothetical protein